MIDEVVILAAGAGTRMRPLTDERPKALAPFLGSTILGRLLRQLHRHQPRRIHIVGGHKVEVLEQYLGAECAHLPLNLISNLDYATTNSLASVRLALDHARGQLLVANADVVYQDEALDVLVKSREPFAFGIDRSGYNEESEKIILDRDGQGIHLSKTIEEDFYSGCSVDMYRIDPAADNNLFIKMMDRFLLRPNSEMRLFEDFIDFFLLYRPFACEDVSSHDWHEIDTLEELKEAENIFRRTNS